MERFMALATRPLEGRPELRDEAMTELMSRIGNQGVPLDCIDLSGPLARLEVAEPAPPRLRRWGVFTALLLGAGVVISGFVGDLLDTIGSSYVQMLRWRQMQPHDVSMIFGGPLDAWMTGVMTDHLTGAASDLPLSGKPGDGETAVLRERFPEDLGILQEHLARRSAEAADFMTPDEKAEVDRSDPDNALWPLMEIRWIERVAAFRSARSKGSMTPEEMRKCLQLFSAAAAKPFLRNHAVTLVERQKAALPEPRGLFDVLQVDGLARLTHDGAAGSMFWGGSRSEWLNQRIVELSAASDHEGLARLREELLAVERLRVGDPEAAVFDLESRKSFMEQAPLLLNHDSDGRLLTDGYPEIRTYLGRSQGDEVPFTIDYSRILPADLNPAELRPIWKAERAVFQRFLSWTACGILGVLLVLTLLESVRRPRRVKGLARGLMPLLDRRDHAWIAGLGIVFPWLWYLGITRLTPLGARWTEDEETVIIVLLQAALALFLGVVLVIQASEWRWALRAGVLGFGRGSRIFGWTAAAVTALTLPAAGMYMHLDWSTFNSGEMYLLGCAGAGAMGLLWLLWVAIRNLFTGGRAALEPNLVSRTVLMWMLAGAGTVLLSAGVLRGVEVWWVSRDTLLRPATSRNFVNAMEERAMKDRCTAILKWLDEVQGGKP